MSDWDKHLRSLAAGYRGIKSTQDIAATLHDDDRGTAEVAARVTGGDVVRRVVRTWRSAWSPVTAGGAS